MFATLLGGLPRPPLSAGASQAELVAAAVAAQVEAGLEPIVDGGLWGDEDPATVVERWRATAALTDRAVKAVIEGPWTGARRMLPDADARTLARARETGALEGNAVIRALRDAGCPLVEVHEPDVVDVGPDPAERDRFADVQRRLLDATEGIHASLAVIGGDAEQAGAGTLLAAPYASLALDLVRGPDNWRVTSTTPGSVGIVCGAMTSEAKGDEAVEILLYALNYAASTGGRGPDRVGVATAGSLAGVTWDVAERRMRRLGEAVRLAMASPEERAAAVDPRAISPRTAALGRSAIRRPKRDRDPAS